MQRPLTSLQAGHWFKLICGASFQHLPAVHHLTVAYALAGADCVDVAADPAVVAAARKALQLSRELAATSPEVWPFYAGQPWLMVSLNDAEDPHFRKAYFDAEQCPSDCSRPCERICPAQAITFSALSSHQLKTPEQAGRQSAQAGVIEKLCYGCGRCLPICPVQHIQTYSYVSNPSAIAPLIFSDVDAIEIHTQVGHFEHFKRLWQAISPWIPQLKLVAVSCPDAPGLLDYLRSLYELMSPLPTALVWQTDGRPMSGDIGIGTTHAAIRLGQKVLASDLPGYVQLAGGTNRYTVEKLRSQNLLTLPDQSQSILRHQQAADRSSQRYVAGVAYGSYARTLLAEAIERLEQAEQPFHLNHRTSHPENLVPNLADQPAVELLSHSVSPVSVSSTAEQPIQPSFQPTLGGQPPFQSQSQAFEVPDAIASSRSDWMPTSVTQKLITPELISAVQLARSLVAQIKEPFASNPAIKSSDAV